MQYEIFADRIFFLHFGMNLLLLKLTCGVSGCREGPKRLCGAAALGSMYFLAVLLYPLGDAAQTGAVKAALLTLGTLGMLSFAFRVRSFKKLLYVGALYIAAACVTGGAVACVSEAGAIRQRKEQDRHQSAAEILLPAAAAAAGGVWMTGCARKRQKQPYWAVTLKEGDAVCDVIGLMDSGNGLYDPISARPVCIVQKEVARQLGLFQRDENFRLIPYHSVGRQHGLLKAAAVEEMYLQRGEQRIRRKNVLLAVSDQELSAKKCYQMLLHPAILEETKGANHDIESSDAGKDAV